MIKKILPVFFIGVCIQAVCQDIVQGRPLTLDEYIKAKSFVIKNLDSDTYVKFDNAYILDRYEMRKPYFIIGDDGLKKRIDLYKLIAKENRQELGTMIFYTNEKGQVYSALQPNFSANGKVWERYFSDIHAIDKREPNFVLKLAYVLSKEMSFQLYKAMNGGKVSDESATYGTDICFPGNQNIVMADGSEKKMVRIKPGDKIVTVDPLTGRSEVKRVKRLVEHPARNYAITMLTLLYANESLHKDNIQVRLQVKTLSATPNHPIISSGKVKKMGEVSIGDKITCFDEAARAYKPFSVVRSMEKGMGRQNVYNILSDGGSTFMVNGVLVNQKR